MSRASSILKSPASEYIYAIDSRTLDGLLPKPSPDASLMFHGVDHNVRNRYLVGPDDDPLPLRLLHNLAYGDSLRLPRSTLVFNQNCAPMFLNLPGIRFGSVEIVQMYNYDCYYWWDSSCPVGRNSLHTDVTDPVTQLFDIESIAAETAVTVTEEVLQELIVPNIADADYRKMNSRNCISIQHDLLQLDEEIVIVDPYVLFAQFPIVWDSVFFVREDIMKFMWKYIDIRFTQVMRIEMSTGVAMECVDL